MNWIKSIQTGHSEPLLELIISVTGDDQVLSPALREWFARSRRAELFNKLLWASLRSQPDRALAAFESIGRTCSQEVCR